MPPCRREQEKVYLEEGAKRKLMQNFDVGHKDDCWEWKGSLLRGGYGSFYYKSCSRSASRASLIIHTRKISRGYACHKCDNPPCVNPNHLYWGSASDNVQDVLAKGGWRNSKGCKLNEEKVHFIRTNPEKTLDELAKMLCVSKDTIFQARAGRTWKWVEPFVDPMDWWRYG